MSLLGDPWDWFATWRNAPEPMPDDTIRALYHRGLISASTNRDAIHGRGPQRAAARIACWLVNISITINNTPPLENP